MEKSQGARGKVGGRHTKIGTHQDWAPNRGSGKALQTAYCQALQRPVLDPRDQLSPQDFLSEERGKGVRLRRAKALEPA